MCSPYSKLKVLSFSLSCSIIGNFTKVTDSNQEGTSLSESQPFLGEFCGGSASVPRGFVLQKLFPNRVVENLQFCDESSVVVDGESSPLSDCRDTEWKM